MGRISTAFASRRVYPVHCSTGRWGFGRWQRLDLTIEELFLDLDNPRISKAESQREALQKIIEDQDVKLVRSG